MASFERPIVGIGDGGSSLFDALGLAIGYMHTWYETERGLKVAEQESSIWNEPNSFSVTNTQELLLYETDVDAVSVYRPSEASGIQPIGSGLISGSHFPLIAERNTNQCCTLWGFISSPTNMTDAGRALFLNVVLGRGCWLCPIITEIGRFPDMVYINITNITPDAATDVQQARDLSGGIWSNRVTFSMSSRAATVSMALQDALSNLYFRVNSR